ncbi:uncharacterized protein [Pseudorca crassidens]|uniref:uncharacterized protein n=1 Tax=Pseudorca crassidens TaxID=82174 RepID=UPI00352C8FCA
MGKQGSLLGPTCATLPETEEEEEEGEALAGAGWVRGGREQRRGARRQRRARAPRLEEEEPGPKGGLTRFSATQGRPPTPAQIPGNRPPPAARRAPARAHPQAAASASPGAHAAPEERSPLAARDCAPRPPSGTPWRPRGSRGLLVGAGAASGTRCVCAALDPRDLALPPAPQRALAPERRGCRGEVQLPLEGEGTHHACTWSSAHPRRTKFEACCVESDSRKFLRFPEPFCCTTHSFTLLQSGPISLQSSEGWRLPWSWSVKSSANYWETRSLSAILFPNIFSQTSSLRGGQTQSTAPKKFTYSPPYPPPPPAERNLLCFYYLCKFFPQRGGVCNMF